MPPKASSASASRTQPAQRTISHFFAPPGAAAGAIKRTRSPVDLTLDSDDEPPAKRTKPSEKATTPRTISEGATRESPMKKYRFVPPDESDDGSPAKPSRNIDAATQKRQEARRKLIRETLKQSKGAATSSEDDEESEAVLESDETGSDEESALHKRFASKVSVGKQDASKGRKKKNEEIGPSGQAYTPLELQVKQLKADNPGTILLFEVGYKYRFFGEDARIASKALGIACFDKRNYLNASIPVHRKLIHTKKLLSLGHRVGIVGQTETAALKKAGENRSGPFTRQVTELYTATTFVDEMESNENGDVAGGLSAALVSLSETLAGGMGADERVNIGLVSVSPATGEVVYDEFADGALRTELETRLAHIKPFELLLPSSKLSKHSEKVLAHYVDRNSNVRIERSTGSMNYTESFEYLRKFYEKDKTWQKESASTTFQKPSPFTDLIGFPKAVVTSLAAAVKHLITYGLSDAFRTTTFFSKFLTRSHMLLNKNTLENLEIFQNQTDFTTRGTLIWVLDKTRTRFGSRQLRQFVSRPLVNQELLRERFDAVDEIVNASSANIVTLGTLLKGLPDLVKGLSRIQYKKSNPKEVGVVLTALSRIGKAFDTMSNPEEAGFKSPLLNDIVFALPQIRGAVTALMDDFDMKKARDNDMTELWTNPSKYPELEDTRFSLLSVDMNMKEHLKDVRKILQQPSLQWKSNLGVDYLIEISNSHKGKVPATWNRVQGTKKVTRFHTPEARKAIAERDQLQETLNAQAATAFETFQGEITESYEILRDAVNKLGMADALLSLAHVATLPGYVRPSIVEGNRLEITQGRHPVVEVISSSPFVPNSIKLGGSRGSAIVITGPNMGGKSSCVKMIALLVIMAQIGCYIPAEAAEISIHDAVLTRMGASDDIMAARSTFHVEMSETAEILRTATERSLVILDELGRGTSTWDGVAIASAVLHHTVADIKCKTLFITHYPQIVELPPNEVLNMHMGFVEQETVDGRRDIHFLYLLKEGVATHSFGVECARLAGIGETILRTAFIKARELERDEKASRLTRALKDVSRMARSDAPSTSRYDIEQQVQRIKMFGLATG